MQLLTRAVPSMPPIVDAVLCMVVGMCFLYAMMAVPCCSLFALVLFSFLLSVFVLLVSSPLRRLTCALAAIT